MNTTNPALPSYVRADAAARLDDLTLVDDLMAGTRRMHERSTVYIKKWSGEDPKTYDLRRECETLFGGFARTVNAATGLLFAKPPTIDWRRSETAMSPHWDNVDNAGTKGHVFVKRFAESAVRDGLAVLLVDHPPRPLQADGTPALITSDNETRLGLRPTWAMYTRRALINWRVGQINNQHAPTMLVFAEAGESEVNDFGMASVERFRELRLVLTPNGLQAVWRLWEVVNPRADRIEDFSVVAQGVFRNRLGQISESLPVAIAYAGRTDGPLQADIPLMGVAWANLAHWQIATDLRFNRAVCGFEQMVVSGDLALDPVLNAPTKLKIGPLVAIQLQQGGTAEWKGPSGTGLAQLETAKTEKLMEMAQQGLSFLQKDTRAAETAEAKRLDASAEQSTLATAAQAIEDAVNLALEYHAWYLGIPKADAPSLTISRDYDDTSMAPGMLTAWVNAIVAAGLPVRLLLNAMQRGGLVADDADLDELEAEVMVNQSAIHDTTALNDAPPPEPDAPPAEPEPRRRTFRIERDETGRVAALAES